MMTTKYVDGEIMGHVTCQNVFHPLAPSICAASSNSVGTLESAAMKMMTAKPTRATWSRG